MESLLEGFIGVDGLSAADCMHPMPESQGTLHRYHIEDDEGQLEERLSTVL